jgi:hypothetical protein
MINSIGFIFVFNLIFMKKAMLDFIEINLSVNKGPPEGKKKGKHLFSFLYSISLSVYL